MTVFVFNKVAFESARSEANQLDFTKCVQELTRLMRMVYLTKDITI